MTDEPTIAVIGNATDFANAAEALEEIKRLRHALTSSRNLNILEACLILEEHKGKTEDTDWAFDQMKRAHISGIVGSIMVLRNEAAKRGYC